MNALVTVPKCGLCNEPKFTVGTTDVLMCEHCDTTVNCTLPTCTSCVLVMKKKYPEHTVEIP